MKPSPNLIIKNTIFNVLGGVFNLVVGFILFPFIVKHIGLTATGIWLSITVMIGYFSLVHTSVGPSLVKFIAEYKAKDKPKAINQYFSTTLTVFFITGILVSLILIILPDFFITVFKLPIFLAYQTKIILYIYAATVLVLFPFEVFSAVLMGIQRYDAVNLVTILTGLARAVALVVFLNLGYGILAVIIIGVSEWALRTLVMGTLCLKLVPGLKFKFSHLSKETATRLFILSGSIFVIQLCNLVINRSGHLITAVFLSVGMVTFYEAAKKIHFFFIKISAMLISAVLPAASEFHAQEGIKQIREIYLRGTKYLSIAYIPLAIPLMVYSRELLYLWMGDEFSKHWLLIVVLLSMVFLQVNHSVAGQILRGINKMKPLLVYRVLSATTSLILSLILVRKIGLLGIALGNAIPLFLYEVWYLRTIFKLLGLKTSDFIRRIILKTYPPVISVLLILFISRKYFLIDNIFELFLVVALSFIGYFIVLFFWGMDDYEFDLLRTFAKKVRIRIKFLS